MRPNPITIPTDLPDFTRDYLAQLDRAVCASLHAVPPRSSRALVEGPHGELVEPDPRAWIAGTMHNHTPDGTCKYMLHLYLEILEQTSEKP
jgi:hypothetical protein